MDSYASRFGSRGDWREYGSEDVEAHIQELAGGPDLSCARKAADEATEAFGFAKSELISILQNEMDEREDSFLENLKAQAEKLSTLSAFDVVQHLSPKGQIMIREIGRASCRERVL